MLIDGEKYACDACVRGHRVSNCHHSDRQLQHIAKKGRPVSQCAHCRTLRKSRSAHNKCDCGEKHHSKATCTKATEGDSKDSCCCSHGGRCSCALKREYLEAVPESESDEGSMTSTAPHRPRAQTSNSENSALAVYGHHKLSHKHNFAHKKQGHPYPAPRHPLNGANPTGIANRSVDNLLQMSTVDALHSESHIKDSIASAQQEHRLVKSEHASPTLTTNGLEQINTHNLPPLALDMSNFDFNAPLPAAEPYGYFPENNYDYDQPLFSAMSSATSIDWSHYDGLDFNNNNSNQTANSNFAISNYSQAPSFSGFDFSNMEQPALTTASTSGEQSEVEDALYMGGLTRPQQIQKYGSDYNSDMGEDFFRWTMAQNYANMNNQNQQNQQMQPTSTATSSSGLDLDELLKMESQSQSSYGFNSGLPITYAEPEKYVPQQTFDSVNAFTIPVDDTESAWYNFMPAHDADSSNLQPDNPTWL